MAYQFADGFDNYGNSFTLVSGYPWDLAASATTTTADVRFASPGSLPGGAVTITNTNNYLRKNLSASFSTVIVGFGIKYPSLPSSGTFEACSFWNTGVQQLSLAVNSVGALQFYRGAGTGAGTAIGTPTANGTIVAGSWYGFAIQVTINTTTGSVQLYINGSATPAINSTGLNTSQDTTTNCNQVGIGPAAAASTARYDDFYCLDTTGITLNALLGGDARILTKMPSGAGNYTNWTPTGLASNWQNVSVVPPNTADFNANNVATTKDSYAMQSASLVSAPYFVVARASLERDDAGPHTPSIFVRSSATDSTGVVTPALTSSYLFYDAVFATDPNTGSAWTGPAADAAQVGIIEG